MKKSEKLTMLRVALVLAINSFSLLGQSRELSVTKTKLEEGKMQLGLALGALGETDNPYKLGADVSTTYIAPTADNPDGLISGLKDSEAILNVKRVREFLVDVISGLNPSLYGTLNPIVAMWMEEAMKSVTMARCWLGCELGRLRDAEEEVEVTQETLDLNPELVEKGVQVGEKMKIQAHAEAHFMSWAQAEQILNIGECVKLPEWEGLWFKSLLKDQLFVLTKDGEILDTPQEEFKLREDWIVAKPSKEQYAILDEFFNGSETLNPLENGYDAKESDQKKLDEVGILSDGADIVEEYQNNVQIAFDETIGKDLPKESGNDQNIDSVEEKSELSDVVSNNSTGDNKPQADESKDAATSKNKPSKSKSDNS
ncbi:hypothetical protein [Sphingobacterium detergens]|uniref:hypothetical protein n=1 Tax=Sphingobacterium detergens TaxID=1145106 RepID=UPI003AAC8EB7